MTFILDWEREARTGSAEAVLCEGKRLADIEAIVVAASGRRLLLTRLAAETFAQMSPTLAGALDYDPVSRTATFGPERHVRAARVAIVAAGTSDLGVALEARRTLAFAGEGASVIADVGVAGLWRLQARLDDIAAHQIVLAVAGMEGALFSVLAGLIDRPIIAVPTANGYGVGAGGKAALSTALASCAPGLTVVNVDNGFGAACAALRMLRLLSVDA